MVAEERLNQLREWGYFVTRGNDVMGDGYVCFRSDVHSLAPSPVSFIFIRILQNDEYKEVSFAMTRHHWKEIVVEAMADLL